MKGETMPLTKDLTLLSLEVLGRPPPNEEMLDRSPTTIFLAIQ